MGELHLEIVKDRIQKEYRIETDLGPLQIAYRECIHGNTTESGKHGDLAHSFVLVVLT